MKLNAFGVNNYNINYPGIKEKKQNNLPIISFGENFEKESGSVKDFFKRHLVKFYDRRIPPTSPYKKEVEGIEGFRLFRGSEVRRAHLDWLKRNEIKLIISLKMETRSEAAKLKDFFARNGIKYLNIPLSPSHLGGKERDKIFQAVKLLEDNNGESVVVHCKRGKDRTGTVIALYRILVQGKTPQESLSEMRKFHYAEKTFPALKKLVEDPKLQ